MPAQGGKAHPQGDMWSKVAVASCKVNNSVQLCDEHGPQEHTQRRCMAGGRVTSADCLPEHRHTAESRGFTYANSPCAKAEMQGITPSSTNAGRKHNAVGSSSLIDSRAA